MSMPDFGAWRTNMMRSQTRAHRHAPRVRRRRERQPRQGRPTRTAFMYLYDELGTALFEAITLLPEYGLTRAELRLLRRHAGAMRRTSSATRVRDRAGERQRPKDPLDIGSARGSGARGLFSHRCVGGGAPQVPSGAGTSRRRQHGRIGNDRISKGFRKPRPAAGRIRHSWSCSSEAASAILTGRQQSIFCGHPPAFEAW